MWISKPTECPECGKTVQLEIELGSAFCPDCSFFDHLDNLDVRLEWARSR